MSYRYTCDGCHRELDPAALEEYGHTCDGWWDEHGIFDELPAIRVSEERPDAATVMGETGIIYVCAECGTPVETEPCQEHQPAAYANCTGSEGRES